jgi:WD40-like Beta Propeller Repeat
VIRWHASIGRRAANLAAPARSRPRPQFTGLLAYRRTDATGSAIWRTIPDGSGRPPLRLTTPPAGASDSSPALPQTPIAMAYTRTATGVGQIQITDPEGFGLTYDTTFPDGRLTDFPQGASDPAMSRDGVIAFTVGSGADCSIWLMGEFGDHQRTLTDHGGAPGCDDQPAWSPDGKRVAFRRTPAGSATSSLMVVAAGGGTPTALAAPAGFTAFAWAPGRKLAFVVPGALVAMNADGSGRKRLLRSSALTGRPAWSPLGDRIAVVVRQGDGSTDLAALPGAGGMAVAVTDTPGVSEDEPTWSFPPLSAGGGEPGPSVHVKSQSARPHGRRRKGKS